MRAPSVVVVGCPSLDRVVAGGTIRDVVGGAGFITALASAASGASTGLVARVPSGLPAAVGRAFGPGGLDRGGLVVAEGSLPSFHIVYDARHEATYVQAEPGMEAALTAADVPEAWLGARIVHVASIGGSTALQLACVRGLRQRGYRGLISAGTWSGAVRDEPELVGELLLGTDLFFLNRAEAARLLPDGLPPTHRGVVCVTRGEEGVEVHGGTVTRHRPPGVARVVDPTGAGDTFCGGFLGATARGMDGVAAGLALAGHAVTGWGSRPIADLVADSVAPRVAVDEAAVQRLAPVMADAASASAFTFSGFPFPEVGDPHAAITLAAATMHQWGFWTTDGDRWAGPMDAVADGRSWRGSEFVWQAFTRAVAADPSVLDPVRMAEEPDLLLSICADDAGRCPLPDAAEHARLHQALGAALVRCGWTWVVDAGDTATLLARLAELPGYGEDPLAKKARLLALILAARPERFLGPAPAPLPGPIVDYHLMRGCLRTGLVRVLDPELEARMIARRGVDEHEEALVRSACSEALDRLEAESGLSVGAIDGFFFSTGRRICRQVVAPDCASCPVASGCAQRADLFQPVFRTTFY